MADNYIPLQGNHCVAWDDLLDQDGLINIAASFFFRPYSKKLEAFETLRLKRIIKAMEYAAQKQKILHLWFHPHNFGANIQKNLDSLEQVLKAYRHCEEQYNFKSLTMSDVTRKVLYAG